MMDFSNPEFFEPEVKNKGNKNFKLPNAFHFLEKP